MLGNKEIMAANIKRLMEEKRVSRNDVCEALGFKYTTFTEWVTASSYPRIDKIELMANYFGVQKKDLVEEYKPSTIIEALVETAKTCTEDEIMVAINFLDSCNKKRKKSL